MSWGNSGQQRGVAFPLALCLENLMLLLRFSCTSLSSSFCFPLCDVYFPFSKSRRYGCSSFRAKSWGICDVATQEARVNGLNGDTFLMHSQCRARKVGPPWQAPMSNCQAPMDKSIPHSQSIPKALGGGKDLLTESRRVSELAACDDSGTVDAGAWNWAQSSILLHLAKLDDTWQMVCWNLAPTTGNV